MTWVMILMASRFILVRKKQLFGTFRKKKSKIVECVNKTVFCFYFNSVGFRAAVTADEGHIPAESREAGVQLPSA